jgi:hypothetical protein
VALQEATPSVAVVNRECRREATMQLRVLASGRLRC